MGADARGSRRREEERLTDILGAIGAVRPWVDGPIRTSADDEHTIVVIMTLTWGFARRAL
jgi:hypothetical protein